MLKHFILAAALLAGCSTAKPDVSHQTTTVSTAERTSAKPTVVTTTTTAPPPTRTEVTVSQEAPRVEEQQTYSQTVEDAQVAAVQQPPAKPELAAAERDFALEAARAGQKEVQLGNLAVQQASAPAVRDFAQQMVSDHGAANEELKSIATTAGLTPPTPEGPDGALAGLTGAQFDQAYVNAMVADHEKAVALFEREATQGTHQALRDFAAAKLPTLRHHLEMAQQLQATLASGE